MSRKKLSYKDFRAYFSNNMQNNQKHDFEKEIMRDVFEEEAFDGLSTLSKGERDSDILELKYAVKSRAKKAKTIVPVWFRYAAGVVILIGVGLSVLLFNNTFWQGSVLKEQISEEMEVADSLINSAEKEIQQIAGIKDTLVQQGIVADNRQEEGQKDKKQESTSEDIVLNEIILEFEDEVVSDAQIQIAESDIEEDSYFEVQETNNLPEKKLEDKTQNKIVDDISEPQVMKSEQALQDKVEGLQFEKSAMRERSKKIKESPTIAQAANVNPKTITINGKVVGAEDGLSIPGVSIVLKDNPNIGVVTDIDGKFEIALPENDEELKTLIASFVGMQSAEIKLKGDSNLLVYMEPNAMEMDEVVVTAYGIQRESKELEFENAQPPQNNSLKEYKNQILEQIDFNRLTDFPGKHKMRISIALDSFGNIQQIEFKKSPNIIFNQEIERIIRDYGQWTPAEKNGVRIDSEVKFTLKIDID
ncbi:MAG: carboxypeptidase-like regulatory domain-containing protein [Bacteroidales bacterium]|nr:carboxypeptidase-like regulatory domain-containing protein [Bacteroidales bacterium]